MEKLYKEIWRLVWLGFYNEEEILEIVLEETWASYFENQINAAEIESTKEELSQLIQKYQATKADAEQKWHPETAIDRLELAFEELRNETNNVLALHIAGDDYDEAIENTGAIFMEDSDIDTIDLTTGYCFYIANDAKQLLPDFENPASKTGTLPLHCGNIEGMEEEGLAACQNIFQILKKYGFKLSWNKKHDAPINLLEFKWESRYQEWD